MMGIYLPNMEMPKDGRHYKALLIFEPDGTGKCIVEYSESYSDRHIKTFEAIGIPTSHGRLKDTDALIADLKRQCKEVFRIDAVSPDDFWITRNEAYNERLWATWCESLYDYINAAPTIIPAEPPKEGET